MITDLTEGKPSKILWSFSIPMLLSVVFQQLYNIVDSIVAGKFVGAQALAAVGASYPITMIFMAIATGANVGAAVTTVSEGDSSQELTGSQATEKIQQIVDEASSQADSSKVNPSTGVEMTKNILTVIAAGYVIFAIFVDYFSKEIELRFAAKDEE